MKSLKDIENSSRRKKMILGYTTEMNEMSEQKDTVKRVQEILESAEFLPLERDKLYIRSEDKPISTPCYYHVIVRTHENDCMSLAISFDDLAQESGAEVTFYSPEFGGKSLRVWRALRILAFAIELDNCKKSKKG
jgi:hypothetical protein